MLILITFVPTGNVKFSDAQPETVEKFMAQFNDISVGTKIYSIKAFESPEDDEGIILGDVTTSEKCLTSKYGDTKLAFKHQWIDEDIALQPEWKESYYNDCYCNIP